MFTRKNYIDGLCTHREYYKQFVNNAVLARVAIDIGRSRIYDTFDPNSFEDIPLEEWDKVAQRLALGGCFYLNKVFLELDDFRTQAGLVCIAKEAARQIYDEHMAR